MDCFAFISKTKVSSRRNAEVPDGRFRRQIRTSPSNNAFPLDFISRTEEPRLLLIVPEHACRCGYSRCRGFIVPKYASEAKVDGDEALHLTYSIISLGVMQKLALAVVGFEKLCMS